MLPFFNRRENGCRFATFMASTLRPFENLLLQTRLGSLDEADWAGARSELVRHFCQPGTRIWWEKGRSAFNRELVELIEQEILPHIEDPKT